LDGPVEQCGNSTQEGRKLRGEKQPPHVGTGLAVKHNKKEGGEREEEKLVVGNEAKTTLTADPWRCGGKMSGTGRKNRGKPNLACLGC